MAFADEKGNREFSVNFRSEIEWDVKKTGDYFKKCQVVYDNFLKMTDDYLKAFEAFENDDSHKGPEAESSKAFVRECQIPLIENTSECIQKLENLQENLMETFASDVDDSGLAIVKSVHLKKIISDYMKYEASLMKNGEKIKELAKKLNSECSEVGKFTVPEYEDALKVMKEMVTEDGTDGHVPKLKKALELFDYNHSNDIEGSEHKRLYDVVAQNIKKFTGEIGDGIFYDIRTFDQTREKLDWKDPDDDLENVSPEELEKIIDEMNDYTKGGLKEFTEIQYDPVNMCSGNYIDAHTDISLGGRYPLEFRRFYNAISDLSGTVGMGWTHSFEIAIYEEDGSLKIRCADGQIGS